MDAVSNGKAVPGPEKFLGLGTAMLLHSLDPLPGMMDNRKVL